MAESAAGDSVDDHIVEPPTVFENHIPAKWAERAPRLVVDVWLAVPTNEGLRALMLLRAPHHGGFWQGVSGRVEASDGSLAAAALRELHEEIGIEDDVELLDLGQRFSGTYYVKKVEHVLGAQGFKTNFDVRRVFDGGPS